MLGHLIAFEWRYQTRQVVFAAAAAAFALMGGALVATGYGPPSVNVNSPFVIMQSVGLLSLPAIFVLTVFCSGAVQRDTEHRFAEIVFGTPVGKTRYLFGRFAGALLVSATVFAFAALGMLVAPHLVVVDPERLGRTDVAAYAWALLVIGVPNLVFAGALVFAVAALTRNTLATYVGAVFLYALYFVCAVLIGSPLMAGAAPAGAHALARAALIDPFGLSALVEQTRYWTPEMRNLRHPALAGHLLLNRALWLAVSAAVMALVHRRFALRVGPAAKPARQTASADEDAPASVAPYRPVEVGGRGARRRALASATRLQMACVLRSWPFRALMALWIVVAWANLSGGEAAEYGTRLYPTTGLLLDLLRPMLSELGTVVLVYFAAELVWRDRAAHLAEILDATPAPNAAFYLSRLATLVLTAALMTALSMLVAVAFQLSRGYPHADLGLNLSFFASAALPLALFAVAALLAQTVSPNRYVGMLLSLAVAFVALRGEAMGLEHGLLRFASGPQAQHSDFGGASQVATSFRWLMLYWAAFAALLAFGTVGAWRRGTAASPWGRLVALPRRLGRRGMLGAAACAALAVATGGFVYYNADVLNHYGARDDVAAWRAGYERRYRFIATLPQPAVVDVRTAVDLYPSERRYRLAARLLLQNRTGRPMDTVWVAVPREVRGARVSVDGADRVALDERYGMHGFHMRTPLAPGARTAVTYRADVRQRGIRVADFDLSVVENGSFLTHRGALPSFGYRAGYELADPAERRRHGLPLREETERGGMAESLDDGAQGRATFETTVSTEADQVVVAPGEARGSWMRGGRRYFRYAADRPVSNQFAYASARYVVRRVTHGGVTVEIYHHPSHAVNVGQMLRAATVSLDEFGRAFGPYPHRTLRIVEVPPYWGFGAVALPGTIFVSEHRGFLTDARDSADLDLVTRRVAHEVGHQWWPHQVNPGDGPGATFVNESLAKYAEQMVLRRLRGDAQVTRLMEFDLERYLLGRAQEKDPERPLSRVTDQAWLYYGKGAVVMNALRDLLGEDALNRALRRFVTEHAYPHPSPSSDDLIAAIEAEARPADRPLIEQWTREVVMYDLAVDSASAQRLPDGRYRVTARLRAAKIARRAAADVPLPFDELLDLAILADGESSSSPTPMYTAKHRIRGGVTEVTVIVPRRPSSISIDPYVHRIEAERADNLRAVGQGGR
ncbi:MAG TPA: M1 family aminopeptidase [Longimicrobium sp.]|nr:M1 family aminopeptidase [Longimicrobium sp.]